MYPLEQQFFIMTLIKEDATEMVLSETVFKFVGTTL